MGRVVRVRSTREGRIALIEVKNAIAQGQWVAFGTYAYDDDGNLVSAMDADGFAAPYAYDDGHRLTSDTDRAGLCFHFIYDAEGRCIESWGDYPGRRDPSLADGLSAKLADGVTRAKGIHHCRFDYGPNRYDADGQRIGRATSLGHAEAVKRGLLGEHKETLLDGDHLVRHDVDLPGRETARALPRGGWLQSQYDALGRVARRRAVDTVYRYDPAGELVESIDKSCGRTTYAYDRIGQLLAMVPEKARAELFKYDPAGCR